MCGIGGYTSLLSCLGAALRRPIYPLAAHITRLLDIPLLGQYPLHGCAGLLYGHMLFRLQRYVSSPPPILCTQATLLIEFLSAPLPSPHRASSLSNLCVPSALGREFVWVQYSEACRAVAGNRGAVSAR